MKSKIPLIIGIIITAIAIVMVVILTAGSGTNAGALPTYDSNSTLAESIDITSINIASQLPATELNGNISDHVKGNPKAQVVLYEFADYQCSGCATINPWLEEILEKYDNKVAPRKLNYFLLNPNLHISDSQRRVL